MIQESLKIAKYKCFGDVPQGFESIKPINLIVGKNSSGKSSLLDLVSYACSGGKEIGPEQYQRGQNYEVHGTLHWTERQLRGVFPETTQGGPISNTANHWLYGKQWLNTPATWIRRINEKLKILEMNPPFSLPAHPQMVFQYLSNLGKACEDVIPLGGYIYRHLAAERNIVPENQESTLQVFPSGIGTTNFIREILHNTKYEQEWITKVLLNELNKVFADDRRIDNIVARQHGGGNWEIYLDDAISGKTIALSQSGSGLKTILSVLLLLNVVPHFDSQLPSSYVYAFEELENNLHPAAQRRLLLYIRQYVEKTQCIVFLTTHSSIAIDLFSKDANAQIIHVTRQDRHSIARTVTTYVDHCGILDDLDIRASDLLQANGLVWVEGPTDRMYLVRWIDLWSNGQLKEGVHYQIVFYGGRLLSHLSVDPTGANTSLIDMLGVNRNCALLVDSDKDSASASINSTKQRLVEEFSQLHATMWVTHCREIEHYLHPEAIASALGTTAPVSLDPFQQFEDQLDNLFRAGEGKRFLNSKITFAEKTLPFIEREKLQIFDLEIRVAELCATIRRWNQL